MYSRISQHFKSLKLINRMNEAAIANYTEFYNLIDAHSHMTPWTELKDIVIQTVNNNKIAYGHNFWKCILQETLINNVYFKNIFI
jgi:hypothetical protein